MTRGPTRQGPTTPANVGKTGSRKVRTGKVPTPLVLTVIVLAALAVVPFVLSSYGLLIVQRTIILALFGVAFNVVFGAADMPSLGHAALFGIGGYAAGLGLTTWGWGMPTVLVAGIVAGGLLGLVFGIATLRTQGIYLLLLTLALAQAVWGLAFQQVRLTGGDNGISGLDRSGLSWFGAGTASFYWSALVVAAVGTGLLYWFHVSAAGTVLQAVGMSPSRVEALGYSVGWWRVGAFVLSGSMSALAGVLFALSNRFVGPENLAWQLSAEVMLFAILGGARWFAGPIIGAAVVVGAEGILTARTDRWTLVLGALYVATMLFMPDGVLGIVDRWRRSRDQSGGGPDGQPA